MAHYVDSGVPHVVVPVAKIEEIDVRSLGSALRHHPMFAPRGANANFSEQRGPRSIAIRTYERGVEDETLACGTGVVASAIIFAANKNATARSMSWSAAATPCRSISAREGDQFSQCDADRSG